MREESEPSNRLEKIGKRPGIYLIAICIAILFVVIFYFAVYQIQSESAFAASGTFYINDAGESHGGFEYAGSYDASLHFENGIWRLSLSLRIGLGDPLVKHNYRILSSWYNESEMTINTERGEIILEYMEVDTIWGDMFANSYVAVYSPEGPPGDIGRISAEMFGLPLHYYVQLSLNPL